MKTILNIAWLHITLQLQNKSTYIQSFAVPIAMMFILGLAIGDQDTVLYLDVVDEDHSERSAEFTEEILAGDTAVEICLYGSDKNPEGCDLDKNAEVTRVGEDRIKDGNTTAILVIPAGFGAALEAGQPVELTYQSDDQFNAPAITLTTVETAISEIGGSLMIARIGVETAEAFFDDSPDRQADLENLQAQAKAGLENPPAHLVAVSSSE
ncbi:MAG: ABC transporter permease, partial [Anaerolineae bacterium]|nr:ABC transporter permease [Anaerolineae bacterium]